MLAESCMLNTRSNGTLPNTLIFCRACSLTGFSHRHAMISGWIPSCINLLDAELGRLGLLLAQGLGLQDIGQRHKAATIRPFLIGQLAHRLDVEGVLQIADRPADLHEYHIGVRLHRQLAAA